ncbi:hypothetical protein [Phytoactinopolyspora mesophila]|uniref:MFS transporter n=1 Tax=Phytoactinopolyspora mesophila TaxID=2650750 RepID=A0A7K3MDZ0_9ACTN|nr:hypothetical protein [Phytoactinopolyspora mesophila]NDL60628.1 hypothetical protein [Phytoactinopolyspora mesophila]
MTSPGRGMLRIARGSTLAVFCLVMSMTAHASAGGSVHVSPGLLIGGLALSVICISAADTRRSFGGILAVVVVSQIAMHLFVGAGGHHVEPASFGWTTEMVASHALAAVAVSTLLAHGERLIWALCELARLPRVPRVSMLVPEDRSPAFVDAREPIRPSSLEPCLSGLNGRAPPVFT